MNILPSNQLGAPDEKDPTQKFKVGDFCKSTDAAFQQPIEEKFIRQENLGLSSPQLKAANRRKNDMLQLYGHRIIRSTGAGKDRHSKICTARGPKDRRVRLSPKTAISFYDVQERLGYDRPSEAIDWLIKEAKSAIDALDRPPIHHGVANSDSQHMLKAEIGIIEKTEHLKNDDPLSNFGFFRNEERISYEAFDMNSEIARLQPPLPPLHFPTPAELGHSYVFTDREPLQSRISNYYPQFPGVNFSDEELLNFTGAATYKEDEMDIIPDSQFPESRHHLLQLLSYIDSLKNAKSLLNTPLFFDSTLCFNVLYTWMYYSGLEFFFLSGNGTN